MSYVLFWIVLVILSAVKFRFNAQFSVFERNRLLKKGDSAAVMEAHGIEMNVYLVAIRDLLVSITLVGFVSSAIYENPEYGGFFIALIGVIALPVVARLKLARSIGLYVEQKTRPSLEKFIEPIKPYLALWKTSIHDDSLHLNSKDELMALIEGSPGVMTQAEISRLKASLRFDSIKVEEVMTSRQKVVAVNQDESLGPLVLDELYKTGHSRFPVYDQDIDHVVGVLYLQDIVDVTEGQKTVKSAMRRPMMFVKKSQRLSVVLSQFIKKHQHLAIVLGENKETVGVISLEDVLAELVGEGLSADLDI